jgi:hypothetical protein
VCSDMARPSQGTDSCSSTGREPISSEQVLAANEGNNMSQCPAPRQQVVERDHSASRTPHFGLVIEVVVALGQNHKVMCEL